MHACEYDLEHDKVTVEEHTRLISLDMWESAARLRVGTEALPDLESCCNGRSERVGRGGGHLHEPPSCARYSHELFLRSFDRFVSSSHRVL